MNNERTGVWIIGARGGLSTTLVVGSKAISKGLAPSTGLLTERPEFGPLKLVGLESFRFGGHEIRAGSLRTSATEISAQNHSLRESWLTELEDELEAVDVRIQPGISAGCGSAIEQLDARQEVPFQTCREITDSLQEDLQRFRQELGLSRVVVVNLSSTEPPTSVGEPYDSLPHFEAALDERIPGGLRPGALYTYAAFRSGAAYLNFTPSSSALCPAVEQLAKDRGLPYIGNDGKTGETLVKSALAPMFKYRNLHIDSWSGFNLLGNRDGEVLSAAENKQSKLSTKDSVLSSILGYPLQTHVGIDYVASLGDAKVAWDFIHFRGFLDHPMSMQFTWHGCDSILAAPVVIDLIRLLDDALKHEQSGPQAHLACFFKSPIHSEQHDLHQQFNLLIEFLRERSVKLDPQ